MPEIASHMTHFVMRKLLDQGSIELKWVRSVMLVRAFEADVSSGKFKSKCKPPRYLMEKSSKPSSLIMLYVFVAPVVVLSSAIMEFLRCCGGEVEGTGGDLAGVYLAERLNAVLSDNWKSFAGQ
ncbi:hypothetical protein Tco_0768375, partial [Tanacetum coccineum]